jgi:hypothetical protein
MALVASTISSIRCLAPRDGLDLGFIAKKCTFTVRRHPIVDRWELDILPRLRNLNSERNWTSMHCIHVGIEPVPDENLVVILVLVKPTSLEPEKGELLV